jgi:hypothetical protein
MSTNIAVVAGCYKGWNCWFLNNGPVELVLVPQVGGRIMGILWRGQDLSFTQPELEGQVVDVAAVGDLAARKREMGFPLWGGEKTWLAPQTRWTEGAPFLDLDSGGYELTVEQAGPEVARVHMASRVCRETGVQITRTVTMKAGATAWTIDHRLTNGSAAEVEWGPWDVSMVLRTGKVYLPRSPQSAYPDGVKTDAAEDQSVALRNSVVGQLGALAVIDCQGKKRFKYGVDAEEGWMLAVLDVADRGLVGYRKQVPVFPGKPYAHGVVASVFNADRYPYFEMETHGPLVRLPPGGYYEIEERQALCDVARWPEHENDVRQYLS